MQDVGLAYDIELDRINKMTSNELLSTDTFEMIFNCENSVRREQLKGYCISQAKRIHIVNEFKSMLRAYSIELAKELNKTDKGKTTNFVDQPVQLSCGEWICDNTGVRKNIFNKNTGGYEAVYASKIPILITEILENVDDGTEKLRIAFFKNGWKTFLCRRSVPASNTKIIDLADYGVDVSSDNAKYLVKYLADLTAYNLDVIPRYKATSKVGWLNQNEFVPYCDFRFDGENEFGGIYNSICEAGDFEKWRSCINKLRIGSNIFRMQVAASFASVLIEKLNILPWILHVWGGTGNGKTVGLMAAMSVWGDPAPGRMTRTMNMTLNSTMAIADFLNNIPFAGDELQTVKQYNVNYDTLIMQCTEGIGRGRMKYDALQRSQTWRCAFMFTGEEPITRENSGGGAKNRVLEVEATEKIVYNGNETVNIISENYGHAGRIFIECIKNQGARIKEIYRQYYEEITDNYDTSEKQAMAMACLLTGEALAEEYIFKSGIPVLKPQDVCSYLTRVKDIDTSERAYDYLINTIAMNTNKFTENTIGETWGRIDDMYVLINKQVAINQLRNGGFEFDAVKKKWAESGYLVMNSQGKFVHQTKCYGLKSSYIKLKLKPEDDGDPPF